MQAAVRHSHITHDCTRWGILAPLSWVKMLWKSLHHFDITLYMAYPIISFPWDCDQVIMEIILSHNLNPTTIRGLNRCRVAMEALFLADIARADEKYLEHFVFDPGGHTKWFHYNFPLEQPRLGWLYELLACLHNHKGETQGALGQMDKSNPPIWTWYYRQEGNKLYHISGDRIKHFQWATGWQCTRSTTAYQLTWEETSTSKYPCGVPTSVILLQGTT